MANAGRLIEVFDEAKARPAGPERERFLAEACSGEPELKEQVNALLQAHEGAGEFLENTVLSPTVLVTEKPGDEIGRYKLLQVIGEGGCGVVYMAEQSEPMRRKVALKVIKLGMDTKHVVARFEAERQALALMDYPNIARVFDAGATVTGRPYFVMELVRGIKITAYCDQNKLSTRERLDLFIQVCQAIQHAHQKGIIHRDIKPSNILVAEHDNVAVPKVIDFGIAKATSDQPLTDKTLFTAFEQFMGTPAYMSPEQAQLSALDIDTRTDIYSLGVLLYELLTGQPPFDPGELMKSGLDAMRQTIREKEPVRPSTRLTMELVASGAGGSGKGGEGESEKAGGEPRPPADSHFPTFAPAHLPARSHRHAPDLQRLIALVRGDLDWIVMKCLEKDRTRRYETANGLAADLKRHLGNEPIVARPPGTAYRLQKAFRRNKLAFAAVSAVALALIIGLGFSTVSLLRERQARSEAEKRRQEADGAREGEVAQRKLADQQKTLAIASAKKADENEFQSRRLLYAADMNLAQQSLKANNLGRARRLLDRHRPTERVESKSELSVESRAKANDTGMSSSPLNSQLIPLSTDLRGWEWRHLWQECRSDALAMLTKRDQRAFSVSFSPDGRMLAVGYWDGRVELWDFPARRLLKVLFERSGEMAHVAFSPTSNLLAATAARGVVKLHHLVTGGESILCDLQPANVRDLSFSTDGALLTVLPMMRSVTNSPVLVLDATAGRLVSSNSIAARNAGHFNNARLSSDHQRLYLTQDAFISPRLQCIRLADWQVLWEQDGQDTGFSAMAVSPDGRFLVTGSGYEFSTIQVWNAQTGEPVTKIEGHTAWVCQVVFSPDGRHLASASTDQTVRLWNTATWEETAVFRGHGDEVQAVAFSPDGQFLVSGGKDGAVLLWDARAQTLSEARQSFLPDIQFASALPGGQAVLAQHINGVWSVVDLTTLRETRLPISSQDPTVFRPPQYLGTYDRTNLFRLYEVADSRLHLLTEKSVGPFSSADFAYFAPRRLLAWREGSQTIQIASLDDDVKRTVLTNGIPFDPLKFRAEGRFLLALTTTPAPSARTAVVWDVTTGNEIARSTFNTQQELAGVLANEGNTLVTFPTNNVVEIRNLLPLDRPPVRIPQQGRFYGAAYSPDQRTVAVCSQSGIVSLYDAVKQERVANLHGHMNAASAVAFSPDGRRLASTSTGRDSIKLWDVATHQELLTLPAKGTLLGRVEFTDDGNTLLVGSAPERPNFQFWRAPSWAEIEEAERTSPAWPRTPE